MARRATNRKHRWWLIGLAGALVALAVACAPGAPATPTPAPPKKEAPSPAEKPKAEAPKPVPVKPQYGGTLVYGVTGKLTNCYTFKVDDRMTEIVVDNTIYEPLLEYDLNQPDWRVNLEVFPRLAEKWEQPDPNTYIFRLRKGVKWHDGKPFTADDVIATKDTVLKQNYRAAVTWRPFKNIEKVDDYTLKMTTGQPAPMALVTMAEPSVSHILPKHLLDAGTMEKDCIGTGPFKMKSWDFTAASLVRNEDYYDKDKDGNKLPYLDGIKAIFNMKDASQVAGLAAGELDFYNFSEAKDYEAFVKQAPSIVTSQVFWSHHTYSVYLNMARKPLDNINVRKALNLLLDRHKLNELAWGGKARLGQPVVPAIKEGWGITQEELLKTPGWRKGEDLRKDQAEGQKLLQEAGLADGFRMDHLYINTWSGAVWVEALPGLYKPFKIEIALRGVDGATHSKERRDGNFDSFLQMGANPDPLLRTDEFFYSKAGQAKSSGITDQGQDALMDQLRVEMDKKKQQELVRKIQEIVVAQHWSIPLGDAPMYSVVQPWVNGYRASLSVKHDTFGGKQVWFDLSKLPAKRKT